MSANTTPQFTATPRINQVQMVSANTNRDGTGQLYLLFIAGPNGSTIENIHFKHQVTSTAQMYRIYLNDGIRTYLWHEILTAALTVSGTVMGYEAYWQPENTLWVLPFGWSIWVSEHAAEAVNVTITGGDF